MTTAVAQPAGSVRTGRLAAAGGWLRANWLFSLVFAAGLVVRTLAEIAYRQPFVQPDSHRYMHSAIFLKPDFNRASGYALALHVIPGWETVSHIPPAQHLLGLVMGALIYAMLVRRSVPRWGAALASVPVLLDPYQVAIEHYILSDTFFEFFMVLAFFLITFRRRVPWWLALIAGVLIGCATLTRSVGDILAAVAAVVLLIGQARWLPVLAILVGAVVPVAAYEGWYHSYYGVYSTGRFPENLLYARTTDFVDCKTLTLPAYEKPLCTSVHHATGDYYYAWGAGDPRKWYKPAAYGAPAGMTVWKTLHDYNRRVIEQQPVGYAEQTLTDALKGFAWARNGSAVDLSGETVHWMFTLAGHDPAVAHIRGMPPQNRLHIDKPIAHLLRGYSDLYLPGPVYGGCLLAGLAAALGVGRARRSGLRSSAFLFSVTTVGLLIISTAISIFSWRYQLVQFVLLPPAGALGLTAMLARRDTPDGKTFGESVRELFGRLRPSTWRARPAEPAGPPGPVAGGETAVIPAS